MQVWKITLNTDCTEYILIELEIDPADILPPKPYTNTKKATKAKVVKGNGYSWHSIWDLTKYLEVDGKTIAVLKDGAKPFKYVEGQLAVSDYTKDDPFASQKGIHFYDDREYAEKILAIANDPSSIMHRCMPTTKFKLWKDANEDQ